MSMVLEKVTIEVYTQKTTEGEIHSLMPSISVQHAYPEILAAAMQYAERNLPNPAMKISGWITRYLEACMRIRPVMSESTTDGYKRKLFKVTDIELVLQRIKEGN